MKDVPKPANRKQLIDDRRKEYLDGWKKLFQDIDPTISACHIYDDNFEQQRRDALRNIGVDIHYSNWYFIVELDPSVASISYLVGEHYNRMFSSHDVDMDKRVMEEQELDECEPGKKTWEEHYNEVCATVEDYRKRVPAPPTIS